MTTYSYSQQQLLKILQITPVKLTDVFAAEPLPSEENTAEQSSSENSALSGVISQSVAPDLRQQLAQDIAAALADGLSWQIAPDVLQSQINQYQLLTPPLLMLQQPKQKKALWALLSSYAQGSYEQI
ncbi:hypothetical protein M2404_003760 [Rheinheimera pacifica]|uniref:hypothetical protein n=1 Tax=Rheinheimera pacifica TaxID=173990 RepID=UPI002168BA1B|nr:hypothetical protein [Rheinheimera pacifica]MCS4309389.1 hypothetical protein [Rheinheimera pacifica]